MKQFPLPGTDLVVSELCYGAGAFGTRLKGDALDRLVAVFVEAGGCVFDTAHCYAFWLPGGHGASERETAACLRRLGCLDRCVIATKGGHPDAGEQYRRPDHYLAPEVLAADISDSLARMEVESIGLYFLHRDDPRVPVEEIVDALNVEVARGRVRWVGASNWSVGRLEAANAYAVRRGLRGFAASQVQFSLTEPAWRPGPEPTMRFVDAEERGWHTRSRLPVMAYNATAGGYLSAPEGATSRLDTPANLARRARARQLAARLGRTPTQVGLAYLRSQAFPVIPIFSTANPEHLREAVASTQIELTAEQVHWLREG